MWSDEGKGWGGVVLSLTKLGGGGDFIYCFVCFGGLEWLGEGKKKKRRKWRALFIGVDVLLWCFCYCGVVGGVFFLLSLNLVGNKGRIFCSYSLFLLFCSGNNNNNILFA